MLTVSGQIHYLIVALNLADAGLA